MTTTKRQWEEEFGDRFTIPVAIRTLVEEGVLTDESWHNDAMPHFQAMVAPGAAMEVWIDSEKEEDSEFGNLPLPVGRWRRFGVVEVRLDNNGSYVGDATGIVETNDMMVLLSTISVVFRRYRAAKVVALAHAFSDVLASWLTKEQKGLVLETNEREPGYCATHKVCDPNVAMLDAFTRLFPGVTFERMMNEDEQIRLWEQAWIVAKEHGFWWAK